MNLYRAFLVIHFLFCFLTVEACVCVGFECHRIVYIILMQYSNNRYNVTFKLFNLYAINTRFIFIITTTVVLCMCMRLFAGFT